MSTDVIIRKQKIKVVTTDEQYAFQIRKHLSDRLQYEIIKLLETVFAGNSIYADYITIDKLKVNLGAVTPDMFEQHFVELIAPKLKKELQNLFEQQKSKFVNEGQSFEKESGTTGSSLNFNSKQNQEVKALLYFFEYGIYPWWYKKEQQQTPAALFEHLSATQTETLLLDFLSKRNTNDKDKVAKMTDRLFMYLPLSEKENIIHKLLYLCNDDSLISNVETLLQNKESLTQLFSITPAVLYHQLFLFSITEHGNENFFYNFLGWLSKKENITPENFTDTPLEEALKQAILKENEKEKFTSGKNNSIKNMQRIASSPITEEGIFISNAGLILLHPFLPSFFGELGLLGAENRFLSAEARQKSAVLLYYLQCNNEQYKEWEMAFNKILCGIPVDDVLPDSITITVNEKEDCKALLQSMVNYWDALKGASAEAVQNTFILREGKITGKEGHWLLQVEKTGVDVLLEKLPWSLNIIKMPWLNEIIYTEW